MTDIVTADGVAPDVLREAFNAAFADYLIGPAQLGPADWPLFLARQGVHLPSSRVALRDGEALAFAFVGRMGDGRERLATMGARPQARGTGVAPRLLELVVGEARSRGARSIELEVFEQNTRALALYRTHGFEPRARLHGWRREPAPAPETDADADAAPLPLEEALQRLAALRIGDLPFQFGAASVGSALPPLAAWASGEALLVASLRDATRIGVLCLIDGSASQADARRLARTLAARHPAAQLRVPQLLRDDLGGRALQDEGWTREPLHQLLMRREFADNAGDERACP